MKLIFQYLPAYAAFIRDHLLDEFIRLQLRYSREVDLPLLKLFASIPEEALMEMSRQGNYETLTALAENRVEEHIEVSRQRWVSDQLPLIGKYQVKAEDITLASYIRTKAFHALIPQYTADTAVNFRIREDIQELSLANDTVSTNTYIDLLKARISETEATLDRREQQLLEAEELAALGSFEWNITDRKVTVTPQVTRILGTDTFSDMDTFLSGVHPGDRKKVKEALEGARDGDGAFDCEYRVVVGDGEKIVWARGHLTHSGPQSIIRGTVMDVTDRNRLLRELQRSEVLYKQTQAMAHIGSWTWDLLSDEIIWTDELYRIYGLELGADQVLHGFNIQPFNHPEDDALVTAHITRARETGEPVEFNYRIILADRSMKIVNAKCEIVRDEEGRVAKMFGTLQDVTRQKTTEQELIAKSRELEQTNGELEKFASVASHDLQEPLRKVIMFSNLLEKELGTDLSPNARLFIDKVTDSTARMQHLINDILRFSSLKSATANFAPVVLNDLLRQVLSDMMVLLETTGAEVTVGDLPVIEGNESQLGQLFQNLISNSVKFRREGRQPQVRIYARVPGDVFIREWLAQAEQRPGLLPGYSDNRKYCCITVEDNGIGFEEEYLDRIFQIFQRLGSRGAYEGTGIGLAVCKRVVENHNGYITARSRPGEGAAFIVMLPLTQPPPAALLLSETLRPSAAGERG